MTRNIELWHLTFQTPLLLPPRRTSYSKDALNRTDTRNISCTTGALLRRAVTKQREISLRWRRHPFRHGLPAAAEPPRERGARRQRAPFSLPASTWWCSAA